MIEVEYGEKFLLTFMYGLLSLNDKMFHILKKLLEKINRIPPLTESLLDISIIFTMLKVENKTKTSLD